MVTLETYSNVDTDEVGLSRCSKHKRYLGKRPPRVNCWACWVVRLRQLGWTVENKGTGPGRLEC